jgi:hypothetical protein
MKLILFASFIFLVGNSLSVFADESDSLPLENIRNTWKTVLNNDFPIYSTFERQKTSTTAKGKILPIRIEIEVMKKNFVESVFITKGQNVRCVVSAQNQNYGFNISSISDSSEWKINRIIKAFSDIERDTKIRPLYVLWYLSIVPITEVFLDPSFDITKTEKKDSYWQVSFSIHSESKNQILSGMRSGIILLDPNANWCIKEYTLFSEQNGTTITTEGKSEYKSNPDFPFPIPDHFVRTSKSSKGEETESYDYREFRIDNTGEQKFHLANYNLPEPDPSMFDFESDSIVIKRFRYFLMGLGLFLIFIAIIRILNKRFFHFKTKNKKNNINM